jgi:hypothetical protein
MKLFLFFLFFYSSLSLSDDFINYAYDRKIGRTDVLIAIKNNKIIFENYSNGYSFKSPHKLHSLSKLYLSLFIAREEYLGRINSRAPIFPFSSNNFEKNITLESLMRMSSGLRTVYDQEAMEKIKFSLLRPIESELISRSDNYLQKSLPMFFPNTSFNYSFNDNNLLLIYLDEKYLNFHNLISKFINSDLSLNATSFEYSINPQMFFHDEHSFLGELIKRYNRELSFRIYPAMQFAQSSPEDLIKVANIFLNKGFVKGKRFISSEWVLRSFSYNPKSFENSYKAKSYFAKFTYGMFWFLNKPFPNGKRPYPDLPNDLVLIQGLRGQTLAIFPSENAIYLRLANDPLKSQFDREKHLTIFYNQFLK